MFLLFEGWMQLIKVSLVPLISHAYRLVALVVDAQSIQHLLLLFHHAILFYHNHRI
jgi:hypothetical protein